MHMVFLSLEGLQLGFDYALHEFVSVFSHQNFLIEWLLIRICLHLWLHCCYLLNH
jgi:hypothetical protein